MSLPDNGSLEIKAFFVGVVADLPARAMLLNVSQFNGYFGCNFCLHPGVNHKTGRGHVMVYPPGTYTTRTHEEMLQNACQAVISGDTICKMTFAISINSLFYIGAGH